jgi:hypothetical protein
MRPLLGQSLSWPARLAVAVLVLAAACAWLRAAARRSPAGLVARLAWASPTLAAFYLLPLLFDVESEPLSAMQVAFLSVRMPATKVRGRPCRPRRTRGRMRPLRRFPPSTHAHHVGPITA